MRKNVYTPRTLHIPPRRIMGILTLCSLILSCSPKQEDPLCVRYEVDILSVGDDEVCIAYTDSSFTEYKTVDTRQKKWSKEVCLSPNNPMASLMIIPAISIRRTLSNNPIRITGRIIHGDKVVELTDNKVIALNYIRPRKRFWF